MNEQREGDESTNVLKVETARVGYQVAIDLWLYEGRLQVKKFSALLLANSIILGVVALVKSSDAPIFGLPLALPIAGLGLCVLWFLLSKRGFENYYYWISSARELEETHFSDIIVTVSRGAKYVDGNEVFLSLGGSNEKIQMSVLGKLLNVRKIWYVIISIFAFIHVMFLIDLTL